jgi:hypothetical protein
MKLFLYVLGGFVAALLGAWLMTATNLNPLAMIVGAVPFAVAALGAFWMIFVAVRREKRPWPKIWLAMFVPFSSLWYYFERVRHDKHPVRVRAGVGWPER